MRFCALRDDCFGAKAGTSEKRALAIRRLTKRDVADASATILITYICKSCEPLLEMNCRCVRAKTVWFTALYLQAESRRTIFKPHVWVGALLSFV